MDLVELGWGEPFAQALARLAPGELRPARVVLTQGPVAFLHDGAREQRAVVAGRLRHAAASPAELPVVGDWVAARPPARAGELATIEVVLPRRTCFIRRAPGDPAVPQALAANLDTVFLVMGLDGDYNPRRLERYLALAHASGAAPVVVLSKADLVQDADARAAALAAAAPGTPIIAASLLAGAPPEVREHLRPGHTVALLGSSGAGKSTLINRLLGRDVQRTAAVRRADARGRHTTTHRQLFFVPGGGMVIDSPGLREIQLWEAEGGLDAAFDDIESLATQCRFRDCAHGDEPDCAVRDAVTPERLASWHKLRRELRVATDDTLERRRRKQGDRSQTRLLRKRVREKR